MDSFELNKFMGATTGALMVFLLISWFAETIYHTGAHGGHDVVNYYASAEPENGGGGDDKPKVDMAALLAVASPEDGAGVFKKKCGSCHNAEVGGANSQGPALHGVMGRDIASGADFAYSEALTSKEGVWDWESMNAFLTKPKDWAPGTRMSFIGLKKPEERAEVMAYLNQQTGTALALPVAAPAEEAPAEEPAANN